MRTLRTTLAFIGCAATLTCAAIAHADAGAEWQDKVDHALAEMADRTGPDQGPFEFLVFLSEQADLSGAAMLESKLEKGTFVFEALTEVADRTQLPVTEALQKAGAEYERFWVANMIWVRGDSELLKELASRADVAHIHDNARLEIQDLLTGRAESENGGRNGTDLRLEGSSEDSGRGAAHQPLNGWSEGGDGEDAGPRSDRQSGERSPEQSNLPSGIEWNIALVNAPAVWAEGVTGDGVVVGGIDTGYDWTHPALKNQYRGWDGRNADHNYNWYDAIHSGGINCPPDSPAPCDEEQHGTHTMGFMVGDDGGSNQIGMAPGARWIGCRCWEPVRGTHISYVTECLQWMIAPRDMTGGNPDPSMAPHVVNNSWVCAPWEGCRDVNALKTVIENVRAAGIVVLGGAGNNGPGCSSSIYPPAIYEAYFSVGATTQADTIAGFSSRGPIVVDGSNRMKPDISAPGQNVRSCVPHGGYMPWSGTSFAGPHVAGLVALLISANPRLAGDVDTIEDIIEQTAVYLHTNQECGGVSGSEVPNNTYGYGRIDAYAAYELATSHVPHPTILTFDLEPNFPNPFSDVTYIHYSLSSRSDVRLRIFDAAGRLVRDLVSVSDQEPDEYTVSWDGRDDVGERVASGVYFCRVDAGKESKPGRMIFVR